LIQVFLLIFLYLHIYFRKIENVDCTIILNCNRLHLVLHNPIKVLKIDETHNRRKEQEQKRYEFITSTQI